MTHGPWENFQVPRLSLMGLLSEKPDSNDSSTPSTHGSTEWEPGLEWLWFLPPWAWGGGPGHHQYSSFLTYSQKALPRPVGPYAKRRKHHQLQRHRWVKLDEWWPSWSIPNTNICKSSQQGVKGVKSKSSKAAESRHPPGKLTCLKLLFSAFPSINQSPETTHTTERERESEKEREEKKEEAKWPLKHASY